MAMTNEERRERAASRKASEAHMATANQEARKAITSNQCPSCGGHVHRNLSLTGWVQCDGFGAEGFRKDPNAPSCNWQGFTAE